MCILLLVGGGFCLNVIADLSEEVGLKRFHVIVPNINEPPSVAVHGMGYVIGFSAWAFRRQVLQGFIVV